MMRRDHGVMMILSLLTLFKQGACYMLPGKPKLTSCRSPDKETFTCWWEPGSDGGLATTYGLFYSKENSDTVYECPDYRTAGANSCFFNKNDTSIWVSYNITVVATNALGSNFSDSVDVDVIYIVQPHTPENVRVEVLEDKEVPFLRVFWNPPHKADTRSGWITLVYELRIKLRGEEKWEEYYAGQQKMFNIFSLRSGEYMIQVRCKPDHGFWSEWSTATYVRIPNYIPREHSMWILTGTFSAFLFIIFACTLSLKRQSVKHCLLPPVPGPKIKGFDNRLLKNGKSEEVFNALVIQGFPPTSSDYEDLLVEYLEVYVNEEQELIMQEGKDLQDSCLKSKISSSDSDSGRGSCDSHTLLMEKCGEGSARAEEEEDSGTKEGRSQTQRQPHWENLEEEDSQAMEIHTPDSSDGRVNTWPSVFSPMSQGTPGPSEHGFTETTRQLYLSDNLFSSSSANPLHSELGGIIPGKNPPVSLPHQRLEAHSEFSISSTESKRPVTGRQLPSSRSLEYVEVQRVNPENMLVLQPLSRHSHDPFQGQFAIAKEDYSKVNGVVSDHVLLLQREMMDNQCTCDDQERELKEEFWDADSTNQPQGKMDIHTTFTPAQNLGIFLAPSGYVDTATMLPTC